MNDGATSFLLNVRISEVPGPVCYGTTQGSSESRMNRFSAFFSQAQNCFTFPRTFSLISSLNEFALLVAFEMPLDISSSKCR